MMTIDNNELADLFSDEQNVWKTESNGFDVWLEWYNDFYSDDMFIQVEHVGKQNFRIVSTNHPEFYVDATTNVDELIDIICED